MASSWALSDLPSPFIPAPFPSFIQPAAGLVLSFSCSQAGNVHYCLEIIPSSKVLEASLSGWPNLHPTYFNNFFIFTHHRVFLVSYGKFLLICGLFNFQIFRDSPLYFLLPISSWFHYEMGEYIMYGLICLHFIYFCFIIVCTCARICEWPQNARACEWWQRTTWETWFLLPCVSQWSNSCCQIWEKRPLPTISSLHPNA